MNSQISESNPLVLIDTDSLKNMISNVIENALSGLQTPSGGSLLQSEYPTSESDLMDMEEVVKFLKVSKVTIHNWKRNGVIKSHKIGRKLYFKKVELNEALKRQKYSTQSL